MKPDRYLSLDELGCSEHSEFNEQASTWLDCYTPRPEGPRTWESWAALEGYDWRGKRVIDYGSFFSATPFLLRALGAEVVATDTLQWVEERKLPYPCSMAQWHALMADAGIEFHQMGHADPWPGKPFDVAVSVSTLEHVPDWMAAVRNMQVVAKAQVVTVDCRKDGAEYVNYGRLFSAHEVRMIACQIHGRQVDLLGNPEVTLRGTDRSLAVIRKLV